MKIYTDGACSGNPGPGGYAIIGLDDAETHLVYKDAQ
jgi:ribonuclease HI